MYKDCKWQTDEIAHEKTWIWLWKGKLRRESESLPRTIQNNGVRINYIKAKTDNVQKNRKCRLWREKDEMINHIINGCSKLAQKEYKTRYDWV